MSVKKGNDKAVYVVGVLAWLVPGAGHWYLGFRGRAAVIFLAICNLFLMGLILGGIEMIDPHNPAILDRMWFISQIFTGLPAVISTVLQSPDIGPGVGRGVDIGQEYAKVAGLLNLLCILDALARSQGMVSSKLESKVKS